MKMIEMTIIEKPTIIYPDGAFDEFKFKGDVPELEEMQKIVGGLIEPVAAKNEEWVLIMNEEGLLLQLDLNLTATALMADHLQGFNAVVGTAIYMPDELLV